jgi:hypothetical protein
VAGWCQGRAGLHDESALLHTKGSERAHARVHGKRHGSAELTSKRGVPCSTMRQRLSPGANLFHDQHKVHKDVEAQRSGANVGDDGYYLTLQVVEELFQFALVRGHPEIETVNSVFHLRTSRTANPIDGSILADVVGTSLTAR